MYTASEASPFHMAGLAFCAPTAPGLAEGIVPRSSGQHGRQKGIFLQCVLQGGESTCDVLLGDLASVLYTATGQTGTLGKLPQFLYS